MHSIDWQDIWRYQKQKNNVICIILIFLYFSICMSYAQEIHKNKIIQGPFKTKLFSDGKIYFQENNDVNNPINLIVSYNLNGKNKKYIVDHYYQNGAIPEIRSVFFEELHNQQYIFVMLVWDTNHPGIGMRGDLYQTYAYTKNKKGILSLDKNVSNDNNLSGFNGYNNCKSDINPEGENNCYMNYKYKTAAEVKKYLKHKYQ